MWKITKVAVQIICVIGINRFIVKNKEQLDEQVLDMSIIPLHIYQKIHTVVCILIRMKSFPRFWKTHPYCRNKWYLIWTGCLFSLRWSNFFFLEKKNQNGRLKKTSFSSSANSQYFFMKISWIGPWVSRIHWCKGHWWYSTYVAVRLSDISSKTP